MLLTQNRTFPMQAAKRREWSQEISCLLTMPLPGAALPHTRKEMVSDYLGFRSEGNQPTEGRFT